MKYKYISGIIDSFKNINKPGLNKPLYPFEITINYQKEDIRILYVLATDANEALNASIKSGFFEGSFDDTFKSLIKRIDKPIEIIFPDNLEFKIIDG